MVSEALASRVSMASTVSASFGGLRLRLARQREHLRTCATYCWPLLHALGVGPRVVVALRQTQAARAIEVKSPSFESA
jgi:hypothetical protein